MHYRSAQSPLMTNDIVTALFMFVNVLQCENRDRPTCDLEKASLARQIDGGSKERENALNLISVHIAIRLMRKPRLIDEK